MLHTLVRTHQPPRRSRDRVAFVFLAAVLAACGPTPADVATQQIDQAMQHMEAATAMLEAGHGDARRLLDAALAYRSAHHAELHDLRAQGEAVWQQLDAATQQRLGQAAQARAKPLLGRMDAAARAYPNPQQALMLVRPFLLQASTRPAAVVPPAASTGSAP